VRLVKAAGGPGMGVYMANSNYNIDANARDAQTDLANSTASPPTATTQQLGHHVGVLFVCVPVVGGLCVL